MTLGLFYVAVMVFIEPIVSLRVEESVNFGKSPGRKLCALRVDSKKARGNGTASRFDRFRFADLRSTRNRACMTWKRGDQVEGMAELQVYLAVDARSFPLTFERNSIKRKESVTAPYSRRQSCGCSADSIC